MHKHCDASHRHAKCKKCRFCACLICPVDVFSVAAYLAVMTAVSAYLGLKAVHALCALLTLLLFIWRGHLSLRGRSIPKLWMRQIPDKVDLLLLLSGVALVFVTGQYPFVYDWITVKLVIVVAYIGLGFVALHFGKSQRIRRAAWLAALVLFAYIVVLAHSKQIIPLAV